jgi:hypothetical protein
LKKCNYVQTEKREQDAVIHPFGLSRRGGPKQKKTGSIEDFFFIFVKKSVFWGEKGVCVSDGVCQVAPGGGHSHPKSKYVLVVSD